MISASIFPTPNTTFLRELARLGHLTHCMARWRNSAMACAFASLESGAGAAVGSPSARGAGRGDGGLAGERLAAAGREFPEANASRLSGDTVTYRTPCSFSR